MKNIFNTTFILSGLALLCAAVTLTSCDDWTDTESITVKEPPISENYEQYLEQLRAYKKTDHKILYAWFDNPESPLSMGWTLDAVPDSVDVINLLNPADLPQWTQDQMKSLRENKGTRFVYTVDYVQSESDYKAYIMQLEAEGEEIDTETDGFIAWLGDYLDKRLPLCNQYGYDGISFNYNGKSTLHLTPAELEEYETRQNTFMSKIESWYASNPGKLLIFEGSPQNLLDKTILSSVEFIVLRTETASSVYALNNAVITVMDDADVPTDRFVVAAQTRSLDPTDERTGLFYGSDGEKTDAVPLAASWVESAAAGFTKKGLGIYNIQNDYFNSYLNYQLTREAIFLMNPSPKY